MTFPEFVIGALLLLVGGRALLLARTGFSASKVELFRTPVPPDIQAMARDARDKATEIRAVAAVRQVTGMNLRDAKETVALLQAGHVFPIE